MRELPLGAAGAVWLGIGAVFTVVYAMATGKDLVSALTVLFLVMVVAGVVGLELAH